MSLCLNKVILAGRVATVTEIKQTASGLAVLNFRLAVSRRYKEGEASETDFFSVKAFGGLAEFIGRYFSKGSSICICGRIQNHAYVDKDGVNRNITEIIADEANFVESKGYKDRIAMPYEVSGQATDSSPAVAASPTFREVKTDEDLPF